MNKTGLMIKTTLYELLRIWVKYVLDLVNMWSKLHFRNI